MKYIVDNMTFSICPLTRGLVDDHEVSLAAGVHGLVPPQGRPVPQRHGGVSEGGGAAAGEGAALGGGAAPDPRPAHHQGVSPGHVAAVAADPGRIGHGAVSELQPHLAVSHGGQVRAPRGWAININIKSIQFQASFDFISNALL